MVINLAIANTSYSHTVISHRDFQDTCYTIVTDHGTTIEHNCSLIFKKTGSSVETKIFTEEIKIIIRDLIMVPTSRIEINQKKYGHEFSKHIANGEGILVVGL
jgi:hypothetical protein